MARIQGITNKGKQRRDQCRFGNSHSLDMWLMAELIVAGKMPQMISPKALECAVLDIKSGMRNKKEEN